MDVEKEFKGVCPFHNGCLKALRLVPSLEARTGIRGENIELISNMDIQVTTLNKQRWMHSYLRPDASAGLWRRSGSSNNMELDRVRTKFTALLNGYLPVPDGEIILREWPAVAGAYSKWP